MVKSYLSCFSLDTASTLIGLMQTNAALFFFFRWTTFVPSYWWFDLLTCLCYTGRVLTFLHGCWRDDYFATVKSRSIYYITFVITSYALAFLILLETIIFWADYGHFPLQFFFGWGIVGGINAYHWIVLRSFMNFEDDGDETGDGLNHDRGEIYSEAVGENSLGIQ